MRNSALATGRGNWRDPALFDVHTCIIAGLLYIHSPHIRGFGGPKFESGGMNGTSYIYREVVSMKTKISIGLLLALAPAFAMAKPREATVHLRTQTFHDRSPKIHSHESMPHHA